MQKTRKITLYENKTQLIISAIDKIVVEIFNKKENDKQAQSILLTGCSALTGSGIAVSSRLKAVPRASTVAASRV